MDKDIPVIVLSATNLDGLVAIVLWTLFMTVEVGGGDVVDVVSDPIAGIALGAGASATGPLGAFRNHQADRRRRKGRSAR